MRAQEIAQEKRFYHWELEFPEVFYEKGMPKENPGWDAVVGNPPYIDSEEMARSLQEERDYCTGVEYKAASGNWDIFCIFIERDISLIRRGGLLGQIVPNKLLAADYAIGVQNIIKDFTIKNLRDYSTVKVFDINVYPIVIIIGKFPNQSDQFIQVEVMEEMKDSKTPVVSFENQVSFETFKKFPEGLWSPLVKKNFQTIQKVLKVSDSISPTIGEILGAATVSEAYEFKNVIKEMKEVSSNDDYLYLINTGIIDRYDSLWGVEDMKYIKSSYRNPVVECEDIRGISEKRLIEGKSEKIIIAGMALRLEAFYDDGKYLAGKSTVIVFPKSSDLKFILSCINSKLVSFIYRNLFESLSLQGGYLRVGPPQIKHIPIRRISFTTPPIRRTTLVEEAKTLYSKFLSTSDNQKILDFVGVRLEAQPEESDVVHDLLAYLAERMIEMNKEKNADIKIFLSFIEGEIGASVSDLTNKTAIKRFYDHEFQKLIDILSKNKKKFKEGYDPKTPTNYKHLLEWYTDSVNKLEPLMSRIKATDNLIDQIVYMLYGLNEDEIKIVEAISSNEG